MKRININIEDLFNLPTAVLYNPDNIIPMTHVTIDSRSVKKKSLYIALKGKKYDGHSFVKNAVQKGAAAVVINSGKYKEFNRVKVPIITVTNTTKALGDIASIWRGKIKAKVIAITGSAGKTSTREILAAILSEKYKVNQTEHNNNNHIGVPLTILNTNEKHDLLIAEVGTNHFGEILYSSEILNPDYALITNIGKAHLEFLKNERGVWNEKSALFYTTLRNKGKIFINFDDPLLKEFYKNKINFISYGYNGKPAIKGKIIKYTNDGLPIVEVRSKSKIIRSRIPLYGEQNAKNYLAATAVASELGISTKQITKGIRNLKAPKQRLNVKKFKKFVLIDDTYNANPMSTKAAIELVARIKLFKRKILILGDMLELGKDEVRLHKALLTQIIKNKIDVVYTIGLLMEHLEDALKVKNLRYRHFSSRKSLKTFLNKSDFSDSVILIKGSRSMKMEEFSNIIERKVIS